MILLADSGSTKTDWCLVDQGKVVGQVYTKGINPFFQTVDEVAQLIEQELYPRLKNYPIQSIYFYGAGCAFAEKNKIVSDAIARFFHVTIEIGSDLFGAARSLCGDQKGIACILGTGSNSCYYDGQKIVENISPLGFILGDEGSGAVLGKLLVGDCLKNQLSAQLQEKFFARFNLTRADILDRVYKQPFPNRFLASLSPFLAENIEEPQIQNLVKSSFKSFFVRNVMQYDYSRQKAHFVGSVAHYYADLLREAAQEVGVEVGTIVQSPMPGLVKYHSEK